MSPALGAFLAGIGIGLAVAMPPGPMGLLCIQRTIAFGLSAGLVIGFAAATVQAAYGSFAVLGFGAIAAMSPGATALSLLSGTILFWFSACALRRRTSLAARSRTDAGQSVRSYWEAMAFGIVNPFTPVLFVAAFQAFATPLDEPLGSLLVIGVFAGAISWYLALSGAVAVFRDRLTVRALDLVNKASGLALAGMGGAMIAHALGLNVP